MTKREKAEGIIDLDGKCLLDVCCDNGWENECPCNEYCLNGYTDHEECVKICKQWLKDNPEEKESGGVMFSGTPNGTIEIKDNDMIEKLNYLMYQAGYKTTSFMYHITDGSIDIKIIGEKK